ncbi:hypothetical protein IAR55_004615 [Kwoniella newhampshirensis]|uniref:DUF4604 domain-containing protein n=1 Tax=Kwoniella newhampshirensis TaxID=1651941 RepID=A0AAW0YVM2_9TREE
MPPKGKGPTKNQYSNGLTYVAQKPSFLQNFGKTPDSPPPTRDDGREAIPERPREGKWARGSDDEREKDGEDDDDEWGEVFGGGGEEGPQVVVLKEGRHLNMDEIKQERRKAAGQDTPPPGDPHSSATKGDPQTERPAGDSTKPRIPKPNTQTNKRKLVGAAAEGKDLTSGGGGEKKKKKKKADKGLLSFNEAEGEA